MIFGICCAIALGQQCHNELMQCSEPLRGFMDPKESSIILTEPLLRERCRVLKTAIDCINDAKEYCPESVIQLVEKQISAMENFVNQICMEGSELSQEIIKHSKCMAPLGDKMKECGNSLTENVHQMSGTSICSALNSFITCSENVALKNCGTEVGQLIRRIALLMLPDEIKGQCNIPEVMGAPISAVTTPETNRARPSTIGTNLGSTGVNPTTNTDIQDNSRADHRMQPQALLVFLILVSTLGVRHVFKH